MAFGNPSLPGGVIALVESPAGSGTYIGSTLSFPPGDFQLAVTKGADAVQGVVAGGPGVHTVNAPTVNSTVAANQPLAVSWTTPTQAKQATIRTRDMNFDGVDSGAYTIAAANNPIRNPQRLFVDRFNEVEMAGGLLGSRLRVTYTASVDTNGRA